MSEKEKQELQAEFDILVNKNLRALFHKNLAHSFIDFRDETMQEVDWQMVDWYDNSSYYAKPEDILVEYLGFTAEEAHKFIPLYSCLAEGKCDI